MSAIGTHENSKHIPIIVGPTGVGKSDIAVHLAMKLGMEIISADAFQVYRGLEVGTAQPSLELQNKVPHHLIGIRPPSESWNAVQFATEASRILEAGKIQNKKFLIVGGAGFYLRALVEGPPPGSAPDPEIREMVAEKAEQMGPEKTHQWLAQRDPDAAKRLNPQDQQRVCRAIEKTFGVTEPSPSYKPLGKENVRFLGLERSRENLDRLLHTRADLIWKSGLLDETKELFEMNIPKEHPIWTAIGYTEAAAFLRNEMTQAEALERIFRRTRQYAKRQWTWFKHQHEVKWFNLDDFTSIESVVGKLEEEMTN